MVVVVLQYVDFVGFVVYDDYWLVVDCCCDEVVWVWQFVGVCDLDLGVVEDVVEFGFEQCGIVIYCGCDVVGLCEIM